MILRRPVSALMQSKLHAGFSMRPEQGILLNTTPSRDGGVHLLMRPGTFSLKDDLDITYSPEQKSMSLTPSRMVETAVDYEWIRYTVKK